MDKFIPYNKLSKKKQRELNAKQRRTWGALNPVTRNTANPKAYDRKKARKWNSDDFLSVLFLCINKGPATRGCRTSRHSIASNSL